MTHDAFARSFDAGEAARYAGLRRSDNPHRGPRASQEHRGFDSGWLWGDVRMAERLATAAAQEAIAR